MKVVLMPEEGFKSVPMGVIVKNLTAGDIVYIITHDHEDDRQFTITQEQINEFTAAIKAVPERETNNPLWLTYKYESEQEARGHKVQYKTAIQISGKKWQEQLI